jgi:hypothetical protein
MPRLADHLLKAVLYLYRTPEQAEEGVGSGGSGFIVGCPTEGNSHAVFLWAVTAAHVAHEGFSVIRTAAPSGDEDRILDLEEDGWIGSIANDDLAIAPMGFGPRNAIDYKLSYIPRQWFVEPEDFTRPREKAAEGECQVEPYPWPFGPGDETATLGRFLGYEGKEENVPVARFGNLAVSSPVLIPHPTAFRDQLSFLVEARSLNGYSGSPVYIYREMTSWAGSTLQVDEPRLLGVDWGHLKASSSTEHVVTWFGLDDSDRANYASGVMTVIPAWRLASLLKSDVAVTIQHNAEVERTAKARNVELDG